MKDEKGRRLRVGVLFLLMTAVVTVILLWNNFSTQTMLFDSIHQTLGEVAEQQRFQLQQKINNAFGSLQTIADQLSTSEEVSAERLETLRSHTDFNTLVLVDAQGQGMDSTGTQLDCSRQEVYGRAKEYGSAAGTSAVLLSGNSPVLPLAVKEPNGTDKSPGIVIGTYSQEQLRQMVLPSFGNSSQVYLVQENGTVIASLSAACTYPAKPSGTNLGKAIIHNGSGPAEMLQKMSQGNPGHSVFELEGQTWHCHFNPVGIGGWYLFTVIRHDVGAAYAQLLNQRIVISGTLIILCFLICVAFLLRQQRRYTAALERAAYFDELCQCPNLPRFKCNAQRFLDTHPNETILMVKFDVAQFRLLNRLLGEQTGDLLLIYIAQVLRQLTPSGCFGRAHDDEFYLLLVCDTPEKLNAIRQDFLQQVYLLMGKNFNYRFRLVAGHYFMSFEHCTDAAQAVEKANAAHRRAKEQGLEVCVYDEEFIWQDLWKKELERRMESALAGGEFRVYLQAQYTLKDETVSSAEALVRWDTGNELVMPSDFIPLFEENGFITKLDIFIFQRVCQVIRGWMDEGISPIEISVNFSRKHLHNPGFVPAICKIADQYQVPHHLLTLELTETVIWENEQVLLDMADQLHEKGFCLAMDDFGTGYSSLSLLKNLPVDILKIDRSFFTDNRQKKRAGLLIRSVMMMADALGMVTIAEGIEQRDQVDFLRQVGCDKVQGYYFDRPVPIEKFWQRKPPAPPGRKPLGRKSAAGARSRNGAGNRLASGQLAPQDYTALTLPP